MAKYKLTWKDLKFDDFKTYLFAMFKAFIPKKKIKNLDDLKVFVSDNASMSSKMKNMMTQYLKKANLKELMRVKYNDTNVRFYFKQGSNEDKVAELLMFVSGIKDVKVKGDEVETVLLSLTGDIDLKQISKLTKEMNIPGGEHLKKAEKKK